MSRPVRCEAVELELSARMDGEADPRLDDAVASHVETCASCRAFEAGAARVRVATRVRPATPVPDLIPRIMEAIEAPARLPRREPARAWLQYAAAFVAGGLVASLVIGGLPGLRRGGPPAALATEIPREIAAATTQVTSYRAAFTIEERNYATDVPRRTFTADIRFRAPESFRATVTDETAYPSEGWTRNYFSLAIDQDRWMLDAPRACPREAQPCEVVGRDVLSIRGRAPFENSTSLPTDIVLPVRTLVDAGRVEVTEETTALGRDAVVVALDYHDATPLFAYLHEAGTWRPFFPQDRVLVTLDRESWFPLAYEVRAAASVERALWAARQSLPVEPPGTLLFRAEATSLDSGPAKGWSPAIATDTSAQNHGFVEEPPSTIRSKFGGQPPLPTDLRGLDPYASGLIGDRFVFAYARGLGWMTVSGTRDLLVPDPLAMQVKVGEGLGLYSPATAEHGRRLGITSGEWDVVIETNLPRADLLAAGASTPIVGYDPRGEQQTIADARRSLPSLLEPTPPPSGYRLWTVEAAPGSVTLHYLRPGSELDGAGIRLYQSASASLPPPLDLEVLGVTVRGIPGRYSAERAELEWVEEGVYRSLQAPAFDLVGLLTIADSLEPVA